MSVTILRAHTSVLILTWLKELSQMKNMPHTSLPFNLYFVSRLDQITQMITMYAINGPNQENMKQK